MIEDSVDLPDRVRLETDLCIVGAGAAGLALALQLEDTRHRVCIIESGGLTFERSRQRLSRGRLVGTPYEALDLCRVRQFGGSTGRAGWGGWCKMLDRVDFEQRSWIPMSGWPFDQGALLPYYRAAADLFGIDDLLAETPVSQFLPVDGPLVSERCLLSPAPDLGTTLRSRLLEARNLRVILHATALRLDADASGRSVSSIEVASAPGKRFHIAARFFVLAGGGIENARLLLVSNRQMPNGLGNEYDLVGRYFMEHPRVRWGSLQVSQFDSPVALHVPSARIRSTAVSGARHTNEAFGLVLRPEIRASEGLLNSRTWIKPGLCVDHANGAEALRYVAFWLRKGRLHRDLLKRGATILQHPAGAMSTAIGRVWHARRRTRHFHFDTILEQEPDPASRVTLDTELDENCLPRVKLDWKVGPLVRFTLERVQTIIVEEMRRLGYRIHAHREEDGAAGREDLSYGWVRHHMGTTRMSDDPRMGVVDSACRVHGLSNLFIAGSSVFPTGGNDMPTLTIVALAVRLGRHLQQRLDRLE
jgi:choline dehydrogenase-like flavoprotein